MNVCIPLETDAQATKLMQPRKRAFHHPSVASQTTAMFDPTLSQPRLDVADTQGLAMRCRVIRAIGQHTVRSTSRPTRLAAHRRNGIDQRQQLGDIMRVGAGQSNSEWKARRIRDEVVFAARTRPICRVRPGVLAPFNARIDELSTTAEDQSMRLASCSLASNTSCT